MAKEIKIPITGDSSGYKKALGEAEDATGKFSKTTGTAGKALAGAFVGGAVIAGIQDIIGGASDYNETVSKTKVILGDAADGAIDFAESSAESFGLSAQAALDAQSTFATFGKSAGLAGEGLGKFSKDLTGLAADMASFSNTSPEQAIEAIGAALRGEAEPIRAYGVLLDDATLKAAAMKLGIYDGVGALTQQQKVLAAQAAIFAQTSDAQGDFARTSGGLAGQQKILAAQIENLKVTMGQKLIPVAIKVISTILNVGNAFSDLAFGADLSTEAIEKFFKEADKHTSVKALGDALKEMAEQADKASGPIDRLWAFDDSRWKSINEVFQELSGSTMRNVYDEMVRLKKAADELDPAAQKLVDDYEITDEHLNELFETYIRVTEATAETTRETDKLSGAMGNADLVAISAKKALQENSLAMAEAARQAGAAQRATDNLAASWDVLTGKLDDDQALIDLQNTFADVQQAGVDAFTAAAEKSDDADQKARDYQSSLITLKQKVIDYAKEVGGLPPEVVSKIVADIDEGSVTTAEQVLDRIARERQVIYNALVGGHREFASGTNNAPPGLALVGERGPELMVMGGGEKVIPAGQTAAMLNGGGGSGGVTIESLTIVVQSMPSPNELVAILSKYSARNGKAWMNR